MMNTNCGRDTNLAYCRTEKRKVILKVALYYREANKLFLRAVREGNRSLANRFLSERCELWNLLQILKSEHG